MSGKITPVWKTSDGKEFTSEEEALIHIRKLEDHVKYRKQSFLKNRNQNGRPFYNLNELGIWKITNEGPIDFGSCGGPRGPQTLAYCSGRYEDVLDYALTLPGFWGYGPGYINKLDVVNV